MGNRSNSEKGIDKAIRNYNVSEKIAPVFAPISKVGLQNGVGALIYEINNCFPLLGAYLSPLINEMVDETSGQVVDSLLNAFQNHKREVLLKKIQSYKGILSESEINKINRVSFIMEAAKTLEVINRLASDKKVNYICNCFGKYFMEENHGDDIDCYEEYLNHLNTLSYREIDILIYLFRLEQSFQDAKLEQADESNKLQRSKKFCEELKIVAFQRWNISAGEIDGVLTSLCRTGFLQEYAGAFLGYSGGVFHTTDYFRGFLSYIVITK